MSETLVLLVSILFVILKNQPRGRVSGYTKELTGPHRNVEEYPCKVEEKASEEEEVKVTHLAPHPAPGMHATLVRAASCYQQSC